MPTILIVNGPNMNLLGKREPEIYGAKTLSDLESGLSALAASLGVEVRLFQSNSESAIVDFIQEYGFDADGMIINPGAFTHYSYAIRDAISSVGVRTVEVHLANLHNREEFRSRSVMAAVCAGQIAGLGFSGYHAALRFLAVQGEEIQ